MVTFSSAVSFYFFTWALSSGAWPTSDDPVRILIQQALAQTRRSVRAMLMAVVYRR